MIADLSKARVAALALTQVVGVEALRARVPAALARALAMLDQTVHRVGYSFGGAQVRSGARGWLWQFDSPNEATSFACRVQEGLLEVDWPTTLLVRPEAAEERSSHGTVIHRGFRVRTAIHRGPIHAVGDWRTGPSVAHTARVAAAAHGGQVLLTEEAWRHLTGALPSAAVVRDLGMHVLTGVDGLHRLVQVLPWTLDARRFPDLLTQGVRRTNVVPSDDPVVGRQGDLSALSELVAMGPRLVTLVGSRGVGRSRLVRQFAQVRLHDAARPSVWMCRIGNPTTRGAIRTVAEVLGVPLDDCATEADAAKRVGHALASRGRCLLLLDGLEDPPPGFAELVTSFLQLAPDAVLVVNTTRRLGARSEIVYSLGALAAPSVEEETQSSYFDAVRLYGLRARAVDEDFTLDAPAVVAAVVRQVGGLPLAIRLLAGMVDRVPPERQLASLESGEWLPNDLLSRALDQLREPEMDLLVSCSALPGTFDASTLALIGDESNVNDAVQSLERRGLVRASVDPSVAQVSRFVVEPEVRRAVLERVPAQERSRRVRAVGMQRVSLLEPWVTEARRMDRAEIVAALAAEWEALQEVVSVATSPDDDDPSGVDLAMRALLLMRPVLETRGPLFVEIELLERVLRRSDAVLGADPLLQVRVLVMRAVADRRAGDAVAGLANLERALSIVDRWADVAGRAKVLLERGRSLREIGDLQAAAHDLRASQVAFEEAGDPIGAAAAGCEFGGVLLAAGRFDEAAAALRDGLEVLRRREVRLLEATGLGILALLHRRRGDFDAARALYVESLRHLRVCGVPGAESRLAGDLGWLAMHVGRNDEARDVLHASVERARWVGDRVAEGAALRDLGLLGLFRGELDRARGDLLSALAIHRDRGDDLQEGQDAGWIAVVHHMSGQFDSARDGYRRALHLPRGALEPHMEALFAGWFAALEAESDDPPSARALFEAAQAKAAESGDPQLHEALDMLRGLIDLMESRLCIATGDTGGAAAWTAEASRRGVGDTVPLSVHGRLAQSYLRRQVAAG